MDDEAAAQRAWELEMEAAVANRGRTRSRSILATDTSDDGHDDTDHSTSNSARRRYNDHEDGDEQRYELAALERAIDVVDSGHDPTWTRSDSGDSAGDMRSRTRSFSARMHSDMDASHTSSPVSADQHRRSSGRRRSCSFSSMQATNSDITSDITDTSDTALIVQRATSLSKIYLVGSAPVDVSKLQNDDSKLVGRNKVHVVQPTGALSAKALDALSAGLQLSVDSSLMAKDSTVLTEEELEERKMEEEEDHKLKAEKLLSTRKTLSARASLFKAKVFKSSTASALGGTSSALTGSTAAGATGKNVSRSGDASAKETNRAIGSGDAGSRAGADKSSASGASASAVDAPKKRHKLKLLLLGDSGVGKTSLMRVFSGDEFSESMLATAGVDFKLRHTTIADEDITLQIWDTAGQERFHRITATYYKGANGIVLVYDVSDKKGFDNVHYWMNNIRQYSSPHMPAMLLVGNKIDLPNRVVSSEEGQAAANQYNCRFIETSAKTSENTNGALETIARDAFLMSLNPAMSQKMLLEKEKSFVGRRNKENCVVQ